MKFGELMVIAVVIALLSAGIAGAVIWVFYDSDRAMQEYIRSGSLWRDEP